MNNTMTTKNNGINSQGIDTNSDSVNNTIGIDQVFDKMKLSDSDRLRVQAIALIYGNDKLEKIGYIADKLGIVYCQAALRYTIAALKRMKRQGIAANYNKAVDILEDEQVGYRGDKLLKTISQEKLAREIDYYNELTNKTPCISNINGIMAGKEYKRAGVKTIGKIISYLQDMTSAYIPDYADEFTRSQYEEHLSNYFADYKAKLTKTNRQRIKDIIEAISSQVFSGKPLNQAIDYVITDSRYSDKKADRAIWSKVKHLSTDSCISKKDFIRLLYQYN